MFASGLILSWLYARPRWLLAGFAGVLVLGLGWWLASDYLQLRQQRALYNARATELRNLKDRVDALTAQLNVVKEAGQVAKAEYTARESSAAKTFAEASKPIVLTKPDSRCAPYLQLEAELTK